MTFNRSFSSQSWVAVVVAGAASASVAGGAMADLTLTSNAGVDMVYSSQTNATYVRDGNLLGTMIAQRGSAALFADMAAVTPTITLTGTANPITHTLVLGDIEGWWGNNGRATFWGSVAFVNYLNSISYGGIDTWRLPRWDNGRFYTGNGGNVGYTRAGDMGQLYYDEFNTPAGSAPFYNIQREQYWSHNSTGPTTFDFWSTFYFNMGNGSQYFIGAEYPFFVLPMFVGQVPSPSAAMLIAPALAAGAVRRRRSR
jgi:hypothetical protein